MGDALQEGMEKTHEVAENTRFAKRRGERNMSREESNRALVRN